MTYRRPHLHGMGQFDDWGFADDSLDVLDLGDSFDYGALDLGSDIDWADYGSFGADDYAVDYGSGAFEDWGSADWGADLYSDPGAFDYYDEGAFDWGFADEDYSDSGLFDLGGESYSFDDWSVTGDPWTEEWQFGDDPFGTDELNVLPSDTGGTFTSGASSFDWNNLLKLGVTAGTTYLQYEAMTGGGGATKPTQTVTGPTGTRTILPTVSTEPTIAPRERVNPYTGTRELYDPRTGTVIPSRTDSSGRLVPATQPVGVGEKLSAFVKANPIPVIAGIALLGFVLLPEATPPPKGK